MDGWRFKVVFNDEEDVKGRCPWFEFRYTTHRNGKMHLMMMMTYHRYENATSAVSIGNGQFKCHKYGI